jgi:hypothetical protein
MLTLRFLLIVSLPCLYLSPRSAVAQAPEPPTQAFGSVLAKYRASMGEVKAVSRRPVSEVAKPTSTAGESKKTGAMAAGKVASVEPSKTVAAKAGRVYEANAVNARLMLLKGDIYATIPKDDLPLRRYVEARFPKALSGTKDGYISEADMKAADDSAQQFVMQLRDLEGYQMNLKVKANVVGARFSYISQFDTDSTNQLSLRTDGTVIGMWRGPYKFTLERKGYWPVSDTINTIVDRGDTVNCELVLVNGNERGGECKLE